jgi:hypothetical protein
LFVRGDPPASCSIDQHNALFFKGLLEALWWSGIRFALPGCFHYNSRPLNLLASPELWEA